MGILRSTAQRFSEKLWSRLRTLRSIMSKEKGKEANYIYLSSNDVILPKKVTAAKTTHDDKQLERLMETIKTDEY